MQRMFKGAIAFNGKVDKWNTSNVTDMNELFMGSNYGAEPSLICNNKITSIFQQVLLP